MIEQKVEGLSESEIAADNSTQMELEAWDYTIEIIS